MDFTLIDTLDIETADIISINSEISVVLERIEIFKIKTFYVVDDQNKLIGVISDGDIRRQMIRGFNKEDNIRAFINCEPQYYIFDEISNSTLPKILNHTKRLPVVNQQKQLLGFYPKSEEQDDFSPNSTATAIAPVRVSFAGGGSDLNYWFDNHDGCVVNAAIQKYARVKVSRNYTTTFNIFSYNTNEKLSIDLKDLEAYQSPPLLIIVKCLSSFGVMDGLDIDIFCDFGPGTGLGGSSSLVIATLTALSKIYKYQLSVRELVELSYQIERNIVGISGGWQDQIISAFGGLCITRFYNKTYDTFKIALSEKNIDIMNSQMFLAPIGNRRDSSQVHALQRRESTEAGYVKKMQKIVSLADECARLLGQEKIEDLGTILHKGWQLKKGLGDFISNREIDDRYEFLIKSGAAGGRLLGAGVSGYIFVIVRSENQLRFIKACADENIPIERVCLDCQGARAV